MKLLFLSDDAELSQKICREADKLNWTSVVVGDRKAIALSMQQYDPDLLLVDIDGVNDLDWITESLLPSKKPVIFMNSELSEEFLTKALNLGADAFLPKSLFSSRHFEARIRSLMRRQGLGQNKLFINRLNLMVDSERYSIEVNGRPIDMTLTEFKIVRELASKDSKVVSRLEIQTRIFGQTKLNNRSLDVHVCAVRKKIKPMGLDVESVRGIGYRLSPCPLPV